EIVRLLARRQELATEIGRVKAARGLPIRAPQREDELLAIIRDEAELRGISPEHAQALFELVLAESRRVQEQLRR
ncbi:MAG: chorismate mutase, partial [Acidimicrobiia bacterium]|nr:chorismate mutase [Acidimicrobiia bacterium]